MILDITEGLQKLVFSYVNVCFLSEFGHIIKQNSFVEPDQEIQEDQEPPKRSFLCCFRRTNDNSAEDTDSVLTTSVERNRADLLQAKIFEEFHCPLKVGQR